MKPPYPEGELVRKMLVLIMFICMWGCGKTPWVCVHFRVYVPVRGQLLRAGSLFPLYRSRAQTRIIRFV